MMGFWNVVMAVVIGTMFFRIGNNIAEAILKNVKFNKEVEKARNLTHITLNVPKDKLEEDKLDLSKINSLYPSKDSNEYILELVAIPNKLPFSKLKEIADSYNASSFSADYID